MRVSLEGVKFFIEILDGESVEI